MDLKYTFREDSTSYEMRCITFYVVHHCKIHHWGILFLNSTLFLGKLT